MNTLKKVILTIAFIITIAGSICGIVFGVKFYNTTPSKEAERIEMLEDDNRRLNEDLIEVREDLVLARTELQQSNEEKETLQSQINDKNTIINQKDVEIETLTNDRNTWQGTAEERQQKINKITAERDDVILERDNLLSQLVSKETEISQKQAKILELQNEVTRLTGLLADYEQIANETFSIDFYDEDGVTLITTHAVRKNETLLASKVPTMESTQKHTFKGFSKDKINVVDVSAEVVTGNVSYYAIYEYSYDVNYIAEDVNVAHQLIKANGYPVAVDAPVKVGHDFLGWSLDGINIVDNTTVVIEEDTTFYAIFSVKVLNVNFQIDNQTIDTKSLNYGEKLNDIPSFDNGSKRLLYWTYNGEMVDFNTFIFTDNIVLVGVTMRYESLSYKISDFKQESVALYTYSASCSFSSSSLKAVISANGETIELTQDNKEGGTKIVVSGKQYFLTFTLGTNAVACQLTNGAVPGQPHATVKAMIITINFYEN